MSCPLCGRRKARRQCPALGRQICAVCCGTKRLTEIKCPSDCGYLSASRAHPPAVVVRQQQRDLTVLLPMLQGLSDGQSRLLLLMGNLIGRHSPQDFQTLRDEDIAEAAGAVASTLETSERGVIYEHRAATQPAQRLAEELSQLLAEIGRDTEALAQPGPDAAAGAPSRIERVPRSSPARLQRDAAVALRRIQEGARAGAAGSASYRELLARVLKARPGEPEPSPGSTSNLILP